MSACIILRAATVRGEKDRKEGDSTYTYVYKYIYIYVSFGRTPYRWRCAPCFFFGGVYARVHCAIFYFVIFLFFVFFLQCPGAARGSTCTMLYVCDTNEKQSNESDENDKNYYCF